MSLFIYLRAFCFLGGLFFTVRFLLEFTNHLSLGSCVIKFANKNAWQSLAYSQLGVVVLTSSDYL